MDWSLPQLLQDFHDKLEGDLTRSRRSTANKSQLGTLSENEWIAFFGHLPKRYEARKGFVVDSLGQFSDEIDVIIHDRLYSPLVFEINDLQIVPAESVYAVFECKQSISAANIKYAQKKIGSVRKLKRTSVPVRAINGMMNAKSLDAPIIGGILTLSTDWKSSLAKNLPKQLAVQASDQQIDIGCVLDEGIFWADSTDGVKIKETDKAASQFFFEVFARLQAVGTVPVLDIRAYADQA